ncbi:hypothetical protein D3C73_1166460 [compost metagenome]
MEDRRLSKRVVMYLNIATSRIGNSTACSSFMAEIIRAPLAKPEPTMRSAITLLASNRLCFMPMRLTSSGARNMPPASRNTCSELRKPYMRLPSSWVGNCEAKYTGNCWSNTP